MRSMTLILSSLVVLSLAAGCAGDDGPGAVQTGSGGSRSAERGGLESCLVGRWEADNDKVIESMAAEDAGRIEYDGAFVYEFREGGGFVMDIDFTMSTTVDGDTYETHILNDAEGTWTASGDEITVTISNSNVNSTNKLNGALHSDNDVDMSDVFGPDDPMRVTCSDSSLVLDAGSDGEFPLKRG